MPKDKHNIEASYESLKSALIFCTDSTDELAVELINHLIKGQNKGQYKILDECHEIVSLHDKVRIDDIQTDLLEAALTKIINIGPNKFQDLINSKELDLTIEESQKHSPKNMPLEKTDTLTNLDNMLSDLTEKMPDTAKKPSGKRQGQGLYRTESMAPEKKPDEHHRHKPEKSDASKNLTGEERKRPALTKERFKKDLNKELMGRVVDHTKGPRGHLSHAQKNDKGRDGKNN